MKIIYVSDFLAEDINGGAELNDYELLSLLKGNGHEVYALRARELSSDFIEPNKKNKFIISNFTHLSEQIKKELQDCEYIIYEHDHKYLPSRDPSKYKDFLAPKEDIINYEFYAVFCQSKFHASIVEKNLKLNNIISLGGNLWPEEVLSLLETLLNKEKNNKCSIMDSPIPSKNTAASIKFCKAKEMEYQLVKSPFYKEFLSRLGANDTLVFFPLTPETLSRVAVEARMMNMKVVTNGLVGASHEDWFKLKGKPLIDYMREKKKEILSTVEEKLS